MGGPVPCIGGCVPVFLMAIVFDILGLIIVFVGIFADVRLNGLFYGDFLIYSGSLVIFCSLALWIIWYIGNIQVLEDSFGESLHKRKESLVRLARRLSKTLTATMRSDDFHAKLEEEEEEEEDEERDSGHHLEGLPPHVASRVTWGKSVVFTNEGYDGDDLCASFPPADKSKKRPEILTPSSALEVMEPPHQTTRCILFLVLAVVFDVAGLVLFLLGLFAPLGFWDFFVLSGPLVIFLSLAFWIFWYLGSLTVPYEELLPK